MAALGLAQEAPQLLHDGRSFRQSPPRIAELLRLADELVGLIMSTLEPVDLAIVKPRDILIFRPRPIGQLALVETRERR
jgi:hypothetical protein